MAKTRTDSAELPLLVCVGCVNLDVVATVASLPQSDSRLMSGGFDRQLGGMAANVACAAANVGGPWAIHAELIGSVGDDEASRWLEASLAGWGVSTTLIERRAGGHACLCLILVEPNGHRAIISEPSHLCLDSVRKRLTENTSRSRVRAAHVDGYHALSVAQDFANARAAGWRTSVDIDELPHQDLRPGTLAGLLKAFDLMFVNRSSVRELWPAGGQDVWTDRLAQLAKRTNTLIILTLGADGAIVVDSNSKPQAIAPLSVHTIDSTGAGDVFAGVFLSCWLNGLSPTAAAQMASVAGALATTARGALGRLPSAESIETTWKSYHRSGDSRTPNR